MGPHPRAMTSNEEILLCLPATSRTIYQPAGPALIRLPVLPAHVARVPRKTSTPKPGR